jgi:hypothetical protein
MGAFLGAVGVAVLGAFLWALVADPVMAAVAVVIALICGALGIAKK